MPRRKRPEEKPVCPRCGLPVDWFEYKKRGGQTYVYAVHYLGREGRGKKARKIVRKCYLGPDRYVYVTRTHLKDGIILHGLQDETRILEYLKAVINWLEGMAPLDPRLRDPEWIRTLATRLREAADTLEKLADLLEEESDVEGDREAQGGGD